MPNTNDISESLEAIPDPLQKFLRHNLPVFPIKAGTKVPAHKGWQQEASHALQDKVVFWAKHHTAYNIGIATGCYLDEKYWSNETVGLIVIDVDRKSGGIETFKQMLPDLPRTYTVSTANNGLHLYYHYPAKLRLGNRANWKQGIDIRGVGGYVVAPRSTLVSTDGKPPLTYGIITDIEIARAPLWLLKELIESQTKKSTVLQEQAM